MSKVIVDNKEKCIESVPITENNGYPQIPKRAAMEKAPPLHTGGRVGIILNRKSTLAWKTAGFQPPIAIKGCIMGLHLEFRLVYAKDSQECSGELKLKSMLLCYDHFQS